MSKRPVVPASQEVREKMKKLSQQPSVSLERARQQVKASILVRDAFVVEHRVKEWKAKSDSQLRLQLGELTAQEIRTLRAVLAAILPE